MTADLKPCPFCGCTTIKRVVQCAEIYWHECDWCSAAGPVEGRDMNDEPQGWNTRAPTVSDPGPGTSGLRTPQPGEVPRSDAPAPAWQPIDTAPDLERVIVAGWQPRSGTVAGYWWYHEDHTDEHGVPMGHPSARLWVGLSAILPPRPAPPVYSSAAPSTPVDNKISADPVGKEG